MTLYNGYKQDPKYPDNEESKMPSRITMALYLDYFKWRMNGTENNRFEIPHSTYSEINKHPRYLPTGYTAAKFQSSMQKRIWYHKELKLMMVKYLHVSETSEDPTEEELPTEEETPTEKELPTEEEPPIVQEPPTEEEPPIVQEPPTEEEPPADQSEHDVTGGPVNEPGPNEPTQESVNNTHYELGTQNKVTYLLTEDGQNLMIIGENVIDLGQS